ncbi:MAG: glycosyltransferase [Bacteroides sp.]|nr:glycosyltransferase [Bacteroides sp.]
MKFSIVTSVYRNDKPEFVARSLESITSLQTKQPDEVVLVVDGPIPTSLSKVIKQWETEKPIFKIIWLPENKGLGNALRIGVETAKYDIVARMDSDDVSLPDRFEKQLTYMESHPDCDIISGQITEFIDQEDNIVGKREVPCSNDEIYRLMKQRCGLNHVAVMFRKSKILEVGNYIDWHYNEDYYLWIRLMETGCHFANLQDILVNVRVGKDMYARRGGWKYFQSEKGLQDYMYKRKMITLPQYIFNVTVRFGVQVVLPNKIRGFIFQKLFRK